MREQSNNRHSQIMFSSPIQTSSSSSKLNDVKVQPDTYEKMLTLESAFYQPNRWQSKYVRRLTTALSIKDSRRRMRENEDNSMMIAQCEPAFNNSTNGSCSVTVPQYCQCQIRQQNYNGVQESKRRPRPNTMYFANDGVRTSTLAFAAQPHHQDYYHQNDRHEHLDTHCHQPQLQTVRRRGSFVGNTSTNKMSIQAAHQFSTIKTIYNDDRRTYEGIVQPHKPMLVQVDFEVVGEVSGVYFMKYAKSMCDTLDIRGWIRVSPRGSVYGQLQGEKTKVDEITLWLKMQGSPKAKVAGCEFRNWHLIDSCNFRSFTIRY